MNNIFNLTLCKETEDFLKEVRKTLKEKNYNKTISKCNRNLGGLKLNYITEYYTRPKTNIMFEIEKDLINKEIITKIHFIDNNGLKAFKEIRLADIKDLC